jgi:MoaA/NifB/PqqE/SkfB family radical SAM enzyme
MAKQYPALVRIIDIIDGIGETGAEEIRLTGGEPVLHPDFFGIVSHAKAAGLRVSCITNGTLFHKRYIEMTRGAGLDGVVLSLDAPDEHIHDAIRGPGFYGNAMIGAELLQTLPHRPWLGINMVVSRASIGSIRLAIESYARFRLRYLHFIPVKDAPDVTPDLGQIRTHNAVRAELVALAKDLQVRLVPADLNLYGLSGEDVADSARGRYPARNFCYVPHRQAFVDAVTGLVWPCDSTPYPSRNGATVGDLAVARFPEIWNGPSFRKLRAAFARAKPVPCSRKCDPFNSEDSDRYRAEEKAGSGLAIAGGA